MNLSVMAATQHSTVPYIAMSHEHRHRTNKWAYFMYIYTIFYMQNDDSKRQAMNI